MDGIPLSRRWHLIDAVSCSADSSYSGIGTMARQLSESELERAVESAIPMLLRVANRVSGHPDIAEEAVQDALLRVARSWRSFRGEASLETWLCRIVIHAVRDRIGKLRGHTSLSESEDLVDYGSNRPEGHAIERERQQAVRDAVSRLPDRQREVLSLMMWEANSAKQVADLLEISVANVHANLHEAKKRLKVLLTNEICTE